MKDLQDSAPYDVANQEHSRSSPLAGGMTLQAERLSDIAALQTAGMTTLASASTNVARLPQMNRDDVPPLASFRPAAPPATSFFKTHVPSPQAFAAGGDAVECSDGLRALSRP